MKPMNRTPLFLALIALVAFGPSARASGDYERRANQIRAQLQAAGIVAGSGGPLERAEAYGKERTRALTEMVGHLEKCDGKGDCGSRWSSRAEPMMTRAREALTRKGGDLEFYPGGAASEEIEQVRAAILREEVKFWRVIAKSTLPANLHQTVLVGELLKEKREELVAKWGVIQGHDERTDREMKDVADDLEKTTEALEQAAKEGGDLTKKLKDGAKKLGEAVAELVVRVNEKLPPGPSELEAAQSALLTLVVYVRDTNLIAYCKIAASSKWGRLRDLANSERNLMCLFHEVRKDLREFLGEKDLEKISDLKREIDTAVKLFTSVGGPLGQNLDGVDLRRAALEIAEDRIDAAIEAYSELVTQEQGRFHGDVSDKTLEDLWEARYWEDLERDVEPGEYEVELRETAKEVAELTKRFEKDLDELRDHGLDFEELHAIVKDLREAKEMLGEIDKLSLSEVLKRYYAERERMLAGTNS